MRKKTVKMVLCASICAAAIAGTSLMSYASTTADSEPELSGRARPWDDGSVMAKITAVGDDSLTVVLAEKPEGRGDKMALPENLAEGETPPEKPADGETWPEKLADGEMPPEKTADGDSSSGDTTGGRRGRMEMTFSDEPTELVLTSSTAITKGREQESASISDLTEDAVVRVVLDGTAAVSIRIME